MANKKVLTNNFDAPVGNQNVLPARYPCHLPPQTHGFGSHTFSFIDAQMERYRVRFDFRSQQGIKNPNDEKAAKAIGKCCECHQHDLYDSVKKGDYPRRNLDVRVLPQKNTAKCPNNPFVSFATFNLKGEQR